MEVEFDHYFPNLTNNNFVWKLVQNPLHIDVEIIPKTLQEEAIDLKCDFCAKINFEALNIILFAQKLVKKHSV